MKCKLVRELAIGSGLDNWGWAMGCFFAIADEMYYRELEIPASWEYSPGMSIDPREEESYQFPFCLEASDKELLKAGLIFERYTNLLRKYGENY